MSFIMTLTVVWCSLVVVFGAQMFLDEMVPGYIYTIWQGLWQPMVKVQISTYTLVKSSEAPTVVMPLLKNVDVEEDEETEEWDLDTAAARVSAIDRAFAGAHLQVNKTKNNTFLASLDYSMDSEGNYRSSSVKWHPSIQMGVVKDRGTRSTWFVMP